MAAVLTYGKPGRRMKVRSWGELLKLPLFPLTEGQEQVSVSVLVSLLVFQVQWGVGRNPQKEKTGSDSVNRCHYMTSQNKTKNQK